MIKPVLDVESFIRQQERGGQRLALKQKIASRVAYTETAPTLLQFFQVGNATTNKERDTIPSAGRLPNDFLLLGMEMTLHIPDWGYDSFVGTDATTLASDILMGFVQAGVFTLSSQNTKFQEVPRPLIHLPRRAGYPAVKSAGYKALVLTEAAPNTFPGATVSYNPAPCATLGVAQPRPHICDPALFIPENDPFEAKLEYPAGALNVIGTGITDDTSNPLYVELAFQGISFIPRS